MKISSQNGLEVWLECRLHPLGGLTAHDKKHDSPPESVPVMPEWTRLGERPHRISSEAGQTTVIGSMDIDLDHIISHSTLEYRLAVKQSNYYDWREDLKVEIKTKDQRVLGTGYLVPAIDQVTYFDLGNWSPLTEDDQARVLASRLSAEVALPDEAVEVILPNLKAGVNEAEDEALKALSFLEDNSDPVEEQTAGTVPTALTLAQAPVVSFQEPIIFLDHQPPHSPPPSMNDLEIAIYRGMYTPLPSSPPPPYEEKETGVVMYNGSTPLTFGKLTEEWNREDPEGVSWCKFIYELGHDIQPTADPYILDQRQADLLRVQFDQLALDIEAEAESKQRQLRRAIRHKVREEEAARKAEEERVIQEEIDAAALTVATREKNREAGRKGWQTKIRNGQVKPVVVKPKPPAIKRILNENRQIVIRKPHEQGILRLRPVNQEDDSDPDPIKSWDGGRKRDQNESKAGEGGNRGRIGSRATLVLRPDSENSRGGERHDHRPQDKREIADFAFGSQSLSKREDRSAGPSRSSNARDDMGSRLSREHRQDRGDRNRRDSRDVRDRSRGDVRVNDRYHRPPPQTTSRSSDKDPDARQRKPFIDDNGRLHLAPSSSNAHKDPTISRTRPFVDDNGRLHPAAPASQRERDEKPLIKHEQRHHQPESRGSRLSRPPNPPSLRRQPYVVPTGPPSRSGNGRTDRPEHHGLPTLDHDREMRAGFNYDAPRIKREWGTYDGSIRVKRERESAWEMEEESEEELPPMDEQKRAYWERERERKAKRRRVAEKEERRKLRRLEDKDDVRDRRNGEGDRDWAPAALVSQRVGPDYRLDKIKLEAVGEVIDMSQLSD